MDRRTFGRTAATWGAGLGLSGLTAPVLHSAWAQPSMPPQNTYVRLSQPLPQSVANKIEVVEFFWYGCPHCNVFEPYLDAWSIKLPSDIHFQRVPVLFREHPFANHQKLYYALEFLGQVGKMQMKVFAAIHNRREQLDTPEAAADFVAKHGIDRAKFLEVFNSFSVQTKCRQARQLADAYKIDGVPALGIGGRYYTSLSMAGSAEKALMTTDALIDAVRRQRS